MWELFGRSVGQALAGAADGLVGIVGGGIEADGDGVVAGGADGGGAFVAEGFGALGLGDGEVVEAVVVGVGQAVGVGRDDDVAVGPVEAWAKSSVIWLG